MGSMDQINSENAINTRMGNKYQFIVVSLFVLMIFSAFLWEFFPYQFELSGVTNEQDIEQFTWTGVANGQWQSQYEEWLKLNVSIRAPLIKLGNQFFFTAFNKTTNNNLTVGKNNNIFELSYIYNQKQITPPVSDEYIEELVQKLEFLQIALKENGKDLFIYITPMKTYFYEDDIPWQYALLAPNREVTSYDKLKRELQESFLAYYDTIPYMTALQVQSDEPIYAKSGTHWTQWAGAYVSKEIMLSIEQQLDYNLGQIEIERVICDEPLAPDADIYLNMNIIQKPKGTYFAPQVTVVEEAKDKISVFARGGSFMGQSLFHLIRTGVFEDDVYIENKNVFRDNFSKCDSFEDYEDIDVMEMLKDKDLVILEVNQGAIDQMGFGIIDYLISNLL